MATTAVQTPGDLGPDGRLVGIDGILDQVGGALRRQVEPIVRDTVLPVLQRDVQLQRELGGAAGVALARELKPWVIVGAVALGLIAVAAWRKPAKAATR
jgi:hypothetical protein